ncbi:hypothetical protein N7532_004043 [Penicillium argentinense]|uniref:PARP-type domain-containing protein n=1 Tax=Penicillium argentinense TaxID=1131581 RepID=A0A9W9KEI8_9EURO|nr:uncharacterized protein N7532_004043 [Penicillium argentinense]KAJ5103514.1 hypothetical protein N7532_004043 [Penicillium argentinense]
MPYRIEISPNNRAGCTNKECKDAKVKITKGEIRVGSWIDNERFQSWSWRHWGCTTPRVLHNITENIANEDKSIAFDTLDGWEELDDETREKIRTAIEKGHIEDDEWNGDAECNRPGKTGMRAKSSNKADAKDDAKETSPKKTKAAPATKTKESSKAKESPKSKKTGDSGKKAPGKRAHPPSAKQAQDTESKPAAKRKRVSSTQARRTKSPTSSESSTSESGEDDDYVPHSKGKKRAPATKKYRGKK